MQVNTFLDEIEVYGGALTDDARPLSPTAPVEEELYFDDGADIGVRDIMCFHNGYYPQDETLVNNTKDVFRSYIGYVDSTGKYVDTMFDAIMFLTLQGLCPSGGKLTKDGGPTLLSDWEYLLDNTFGEGINLDALNEATAELKADLDLPDTHKTAVYLTVPYPKISDLVVRRLERRRHRREDFHPRRLRGRLLLVRRRMHPPLCGERVRASRFQGLFLVQRVDHRGRKRL